MSFDPLSAALVFTGLWLIGVTNLQTAQLLFALQTILLGGLACWRGVQLDDATLVVAGAAFILLKGIGVPLYLSYVTRQLGSPRDEGMHLSPPVLLFGTVASLSALLLVPSLQAVVPPPARPAFALLFIGMLLMLSRRLAISQIVGFLVLENSIFLYTISQPYSMPLVVELGVLLEILVWTMMAGVLAFHIKERFESIDVSAMRELRG
jgi:hydrogenase-4 component E